MRRIYATPDPPASESQALKITNRHKEIDGLLRALLIQLEKDKPRVAPLDPEGDKCV
jgi:hypothetical protein